MRSQKLYLLSEIYFSVAVCREIPASPILFYFPCFDKTQFCGDIEPQFFPGLVKNRACIENWNLTEQEQVLVWPCLITVTFNNCLRTSIYSCFKDIYILRQFVLTCTLRTGNKHRSTRKSVDRQYIMRNTLNSLFKIILL